MKETQDSQIARKSFVVVAVTRSELAGRVEGSTSGAEAKDLETKT